MIRHILVLFIATLGLLFVTLPATAASTVDCHCFRDREFSPENPAAYDAYLLATVQNRLMAYAFDVPRKEIVSLKMTGGAQGEPLWVAYWVAKASSLPVNEVRDVYAKTSSWKKTVAGLSAKPEKLGPLFNAGLAADDEVLLAWAVAAQVSQKFTPRPGVYAELKKRGASLKEAILASLLAELKDDSAVSLFDHARAKGHWGSLLVSSHLTIESIESFLKNSFASQ